MSTVSLFVKDAGFSNNLRGLVELAKFAVERIIAAHALQPARVEANAIDQADAAYFVGVESHEELESRLRMRERSHQAALTQLQALV